MFAPSLNESHSHSVQSVQSLCCVRPFAAPWTAACQASLSITYSWSYLGNSCGANLHRVLYALSNLQSLIGIASLSPNLEKSVLLLSYYLHLSSEETET